MNLIEQSNVLRGLSDDSLKAEMQSPSGSAPPFLVLTELNRRKSMRERYDGERARAARNNRTIAEDITAQMGGGIDMGGGGAAATPPPPMAGGLPEPAGMTPSQPQGFADGGIVGGLDFDAIGARYLDKLNGVDANRDRARAMALIAAGAGIMGAGSSNTLTNLGRGIQQGVTYYQDQVNAIDSDEMQLLRDAMSLGQTDASMDLQQLEFDALERERKRQAALDERRIEISEAELAARDTDTETAAQKNWSFAQTLPPGQREDFITTFIGGNGEGGPSASDVRAGNIFQGLFDDALKRIADAEKSTAGMEAEFSEDPTARAQYADQLRTRAYQEALTLFETLYPELKEQADRYRQNAQGLNGVSSSPTQPMAPSSAGAPVSWETFFGG